MLVVDVRKYPEHVSCYVSYDVHEIDWEWHASLGWEQGLVGQLYAYPVENVFDVLVSRQGDGFVVLVSPVVLRVWACRHGGIKFWLDVLSNDAVELVQVVVQLKHV